MGQSGLDQQETGKPVEIGWFLTREGMRSTRTPVKRPQSFRASYSCIRISHLTLLGLQSRFGDNLGQTSRNLTGVSPKRDWGSKRDALYIKFTPSCTMALEFPMFPSSSACLS